jgi:hypothetical protein
MATPARIVPEFFYIRDAALCPKCDGRKPDGVVLCHHCHNTEVEGHNGGYSGGTMQMLASHEQMLCRMACGR